MLVGTLVPCTLFTKHYSERTHTVCVLYTPRPGISQRTWSLLPRGQFHRAAEQKKIAYQRNLLNGFLLGYQPNIHTSLMHLGWWSVLHYLTTILCLA